MCVLASSHCFTTFYKVKKIKINIRLLSREVSSRFLILYYSHKFTKIFIKNYHKGNNNNFIILV